MIVHKSAIQIRAVQKIPKHPNKAPFTAKLSNFDSFSSSSQNRDISLLRNGKMYLADFLSLFYSIDLFLNLFLNKLL